MSRSRLKEDFSKPNGRKTMSPNYYTSYFQRKKILSFETVCICKRFFFIFWVPSEMCWQIYLSSVFFNEMSSEEKIIVEWEVCGDSRAVLFQKRKDKVRTNKWRRICWTLVVAVNFWTTRRPWLPSLSNEGGSFLLSL